MPVLDGNHALAVAEIVNSAGHQHNIACNQLVKEAMEKRNKLTLSPRQIASQTSLLWAIERTRPAIDTTLLHGAATPDLPNLTLVALDKIEVAFSHKGGDRVTADLSCSRADWVVDNRCTTLVVSLEGFQVVRYTLAVQSAHVDEKRSIQLGQVCSFVAVGSHDR